MDTAKLLLAIAAAALLGGALSSARHLAAGVPRQAASVVVGTWLGITVLPLLDLVDEVRGPAQVAATTAMYGLLAALGVAVSQLPIWLLSRRGATRSRLYLTAFLAWLVACHVVPVATVALLYAFGTDV